MRKTGKYRLLIVVVLSSLGLAFVGCGSGGDDNDSGLTTSTASKANITVSAGNYSLWVSPVRGRNWRLTIPVTMTESAGVGANINYVRMTSYFLGYELERNEIGSADFRTMTGSSRVEANQTRKFDLAFDYNEDRGTSATILFSFTDDKGNSLTGTLSLVGDL